MKAKQLLYVSALCFLSSGCALSDNLFRTTVVQPVQFCNYWDEKREHHYFRKLAGQELERARATARAELDNYACEPFSVDEECGFEDGFVDFLLYGGTGHPPPLPPRRYWRIKHQNSDGYQAIQDWFRGYQRGAAVAQATEYRDFVTVSTSDALIKDTLPFYPGQLSDVEHTESDESLRDETNDESPSGLLARAVHLPPSPLPSDAGSPLPGARLPAAPETSPQFDQIPVFAVRVLSDTDRPQGMNPVSSFGSQYSTDADPVSSQGTDDSTGIHPALSRGNESPNGT